MTGFIIFENFFLSQAIQLGLLGCFNEIGIITVLGIIAKICLGRALFYNEIDIVIYTERVAKFTIYLC